jgi:hypothetical protein
MSNLSSNPINSNTTENKINIEDISNDSFDNDIDCEKIYKDITSNPNLKISFIKKFDLDSITNIKNIQVNKQNTTKSNNLKNNGKNYSKFKCAGKYNINNETKKILEKSQEEYQIALEKYYKDVLEWSNQLFNSDAKSILNIKLKKITLNEDIFNSYNNIIKKYKLEKDLFDVNNFNIEDFHDPNDILKIVKIMTNNLLIKLGYSLKFYKYNKTTKIKIISIMNES